MNRHKPVLHCVELGGKPTATFLQQLELALLLTLQERGVITTQQYQRIAAMGAK